MPVYVCGSKLANKLKHRLFAVHDSDKWNEVLHMGLMVQNNYKWYEHTHVLGSIAQFKNKGQSYTSVGF